MDLRRLVHECYQPIYRYAFRLTGSTTDAEDLVQETFLMAHAHQAQLRDDTKVMAWLYGILRGCVGKYYRRRRPVAAVTLDLDLDRVPEVFPDEPFDAEALQAALQELTDEHRLVLLMFYFEDLSYQQIAQSLDVPIGTVMSRLARAKSHLRLRLAGDRRRPDATKPIAAPRPESGDSNGRVESNYVGRSP